jgi:hypothetical protein
MAKVKKGGPKKKAGERYTCGKLKEGNVVSEFALQRRAEAAGITTEEAAKRMEAGYALGQLLTRRVITVRQHDAGMAYRAAWLRWASLAGLPPHEVTKKGSGAQRPDVDPEQWDKAKTAFAESTAAIMRCEQSRLVWSAVESVVMDDVLPPLMETRWVAVAALNAGLSALASYYKMPDRLAW